MAALAESDLYADIFRNVPFAISVFRLEDPADLSTFRIVDANPIAAKLLGVELKDLIGKTFADFPRFLDTTFPGEYADVIRSGKPRELGEIRYGDSIIREGVYKVRAFPLGGDCVGIAFENVTGLSQAEQALRESEQRYRSWFENAPLPMWVYDADRLSFLTVNDAAIRKYGYSRQEFLGMTIKDIRPDAEIPHLLELIAAPEHDSTKISTVRHRTKDGTTLLVEVYSQLGSWAGTRAKLVQVRDVSELSQAQLSRLQEEERRKIARDLHDTIGQSLTALSGNLVAVAGIAEVLPPRQRMALSESLSLAQNASREIRTLSYLLYPPMLDEEGLASALDFYIDGFSARSGISVVLEISPAIGRLPQELETTLFRIVQESLTNMHRHAETSSGEIRMRVVAGEIVLEVQDRGRGIAQPILDKINRDSPGVGVGIAGMRERMRQVGGRLEIESGSLGTTIRALLPFSKDLRERR